MTREITQVNQVAWFLHRLSFEGMLTFVSVLECLCRRTHKFVEMQRRVYTRPSMCAEAVLTYDLIIWVGLAPCALMTLTPGAAQWSSISRRRHLTCNVCPKTRKPIELTISIDWKGQLPSCPAEAIPRRCPKLLVSQLPLPGYGSLQWGSWGWSHLMWPRLIDVFGTVFQNCGEEPRRFH